MEVTKLQVRSLFDSKVQYKIPLFQRHYVWDREDQWQPLWEDIERKSNRRLSQHQVQGFSHFTGSIVVQQDSPHEDEIEKYEIIDGQQRLTTFQIVLCVLRDISKEHNHVDVANDINLYIWNSGMLLSEDERYKLVPTEFDKEAFQSLVNGSTDLGDNRIHSAYRYFKGEIADYVNGQKKKILALLRSILLDFSLVQILLGSGDAPEEIFESINARGKSLLEFDLLRNNLFLRAGADRNRLYKKYWEHFETPYWDPDVKKLGTSSELFLQHFLMAKLGTEQVNPEFKAYQRRYRQGLEDNGFGVEYEFSELKRYSDIYQEMTDCKDDSEIGRRMKFYQIFKLTTLHPFILFVTCEVGLSGDALQYVFDILESYTIRRMLCCRGEGGLKNYNRFFSKLIREFGKDFSVRNFIERLAKETSDTQRHPSDDEVEPALHIHYDDSPTLFPDEDTVIFPDNLTIKAALHRHWFETVGQIKIKLIRYILYRIEQTKEGEDKFTEPAVFNDTDFTLEHVMPINWQKTWRLPVKGTIVREKDGLYLNSEVGDTGFLLHYKELFTDDYIVKNPQFFADSGKARKPNLGKPSRDGLAKESYSHAFNLAIVRDDFLHSIGNLTLVTRQLNSRLRDKQFPEKKEFLNKHSRLKLNKAICDQHDNWDVNEIRNRAEELILYFCEIWPSLDWFTENVS